MGEFDPNYNFGNVKFSEITVQDFYGRRHTVPEDYLASVGKDKQLMQYIKPDSVIGKQINNELQQVRQEMKIRMN
ncbi:MAG: hypothetical protein LN588_00810 [Rickettsia endosymbiont of Bryobia graminum]|nr:hypothetical protein [Rickettsia endosymbiont of Bryobia graminum]